MQADGDNIFADFQKGLGIEAVFTTALAALLRRSDALRTAFLGWVAESTGLPLDPSDRWDIECEFPVQVGTHLARGKCSVDMVMRSAGLELWFEHKIGSPLRQPSPGCDQDQLANYLDAAWRRRHGITHLGPLPPVSECPVSTSDRVALIVISKCRQNMARYRGRRAEFEDTGCGLLLPGTKGYLEWQSFLPIARDVVDRLEGFVGELARHFVAWWREIPGMESHAVPAGWAELFKMDGSTFVESPLRGLWARELDTAEKLGWRTYSLPYKGNDHLYKVPFVEGLRQVQVKALADASKSQAYVRGMRPEAIEVSFAGTAVPRLAPTTGESEGRKWSLRSEAEPKNKGHIRVRLLVEVGDWEAADNVDRESLLFRAFQVAVTTFEHLAGMQLSPEERAP